MGSKEQLLENTPEDKQVRIRTLGSTSVHPFTGEDEIDRIVRERQGRGEKIVEVQILRPSLEDVYFRTVGRSEHELV